MPSSPWRTGRLDGGQRELELSEIPPAGESRTAPFSSRTDQSSLNTSRPASEAPAIPGRPRCVFSSYANLPARRVGPGEVRQVQVAHAEERELESVGPSVRRREVPGVVPPLDGRLRVRAVVAREQSARMRRRREEGRARRRTSSSLSLLLQRRGRIDRRGDAARGRRRRETTRRARARRHRPARPRARAAPRSSRTTAD